MKYWLQPQPTQSLAKSSLLQTIAASREARWKNLPKFQNAETIHEAEGLEMINKIQGCLYFLLPLDSTKIITDDLTNDTGRLRKFAKIPEILDNPEVSMERRANLVFRYSGDP